MSDPSTLMLSFPQVALLPGSVTTRSLTMIRPLLIISSAFRREVIPARDRILLIR